MYKANQSPTESEKQLYLNFIRKEVLKALNIDYNTFVSYDENIRFLKALSRVTATKRAICEAFEIRIDNACRYKRLLEEQGFLKQSKYKHVCKHSGYKAYLLTTNPKIINL
jgi:hypothetical protein